VTVSAGRESPPAAAVLAAQSLTLSSLTLGRHVGFEERVAVAARAGFTGIGLRAEDYLEAIESGMDDAGMQTVLDHHGVAVTEVELLAGWGTEADGRAGQREREETIFHVARTFGADHVNAALFPKRPSGSVVHAFRQLCRRARDQRVALEFMPFSGLPDPAAAWYVVAGAGSPNAGLLVDAWHWSRARASVEDLARIPAERIFAVQLSDVGPVPHPDLRAETLHHRLPPGEGCGDVAAMVAALRELGVDAMVSVEVMSDDLLAQGLQVTADRVLAAARAVLGSPMEDT
jgi:sugar phosphate isomerase/epimerase